MSSASPRSASAVSRPSSQPGPAEPELVDPELVDPNPNNPDPGDSQAGRRPRRRRGGTRNGLVRPRCPEHGGEMLVGRTVGCVQYRYCTVEGCSCATTTFRSDAPHKRWPPASHQAVPPRERGAESGNDRTGQPGGAPADGVTIIPHESPVTKMEWPVGRPLPGQSS